MLKLYFITVLVVTGYDTMPEGWIQWTKAYKDKAVCEKVIETDKANIIMGISSYFRKGGGKFVMAKNFECMTHEEAVKRNTKLGH
jgi:hypothetical protein